jgi:1-acyl-sn-glycerol-3-phosphate acyltransferase
MDAHAAPRIDRALWRGTLVPLVRSFIRLGYFGFEIEGAENVPRSGRVVYAGNHAGWFPLDAFFVGLAVADVAGDERTPFFAASEAALAIPGLGAFLRRVSAIPASWLRRPERLPPEIESIGVFPEGVEGNCKPFWNAYRMRPWRRGFVRVAAALDAPVVPVAVLGGEECLPVAWTVRRLEPLVGSIFGLPLAGVPLPSRWKIVFHPPLRVEGDARRVLKDHASADAFARRVRAVVEATLDREAAARPLARLSSAVARAAAEAPADEDPLDAPPASSSASGP